MTFRPTHNAKPAKIISGLLSRDRLRDLQLASRNRPSPFPDFPLTRSPLIQRCESVDTNATVTTPHAESDHAKILVGEGTTFRRELNHTVCDDDASELPKSKPIPNVRVNLLNPSTLTPAVYVDDLSNEQTRQQGLTPKHYITYPM